MIQKKNLTLHNTRQIKTLLSSFLTQYVQINAGKFRMVFLPHASLILFLKLTQQYSCSITFTDIN